MGLRNKLKNFIFKRDKNYKLRDLSIRLPSNHNLPAYQKIHNLYDRFLPFLGKFLKPNQFIIDVGANCGDTLGLMVSENKNLNFICIEPDKDFFEYLKINSYKIRQKCFGKIILENSLVGKDIKSNQLREIFPGTKTLSNELNKKSKCFLNVNELDKIISSKLASSEKISLIKIDTDGYDFDVIKSAKCTILDHKPLLYFECYIIDENLLSQYKESLKELKKWGYSEFFVFDNFGSYMFKTNKVDIISDLLNYHWFQSRGISSRTSFYIDIFAVTNKDRKFANKVVLNYLNHYYC